MTSLQTKNVVENIAKILENSPYSIRQFSQKVGISETTIHKILKGKQDVKVETLESFAKALDVPLGSFFNESAESLSKDLKILTAEIDLLKAQNEKYFLHNKEIIRDLRGNEEALEYILNYISNHKNPLIRPLKEELKNLEKIKFLIEYEFIDGRIFE